MSVPYEDGVPLTDDVVTGASFTAGSMTLTKQVGADITASIGGFFSAQVTHDDSEFDVLGGNPADTDGDEKDGEITALAVTGINGNASKVLLQFSITGEWDNLEHDKGVAIARRVSDTVDGTYAGNTILRADVAGSNNVRLIQNFNISHNVGNRDSTLESCNGIFIDDATTSNKFYKYSVVLINSEVTTRKFYLNRTLNPTNTAGYERGTSCITAQEF